MTARILLLFILVPLVELALLSQLSLKAGLLPTVLIVVATGFIGAHLARRQGRQAWRAIHAELAAGRTPGPQIVDAVLILVAGILLITPGILTDCVGFLLLIPMIRRRIALRLRTWFARQSSLRFSTAHAPPPPSPDFADQYSGGPSVRVVDPHEERLER